MANPLSGLWFVYIAVHVLTVLTQAGIGYWVYRHQWHRSGSRWFLVMVATGILWVLPVGLFFLPLAAPLKEAAYLFGSVGAVATISAFVVFISKYTGNTFHRNRIVQAHLLVVLCGTVLLAVTNDFHGLLVAEFTPVSEPFPYLATERGVVFEVFTVSLQLPAFYSVYLMIKHLLATQRKSRIQLLLFTIGAVAISALDTLSLYTGLLPVDVTHATFGMLVFYLFTALSLFRFRLLDIKPVARNTIVENLQDPVLVVDDQRRIVDYNEAALDIWPAIAGSGDTPFDETCPTLAEGIDGFTESTAEFVTEQMPLQLNGQQRHYSVTVSNVEADGGGETEWYAVLLRDITELEQSRWQLEKQNERLDQVASTVSHDLRNPINVASGNIELMQLDLEEAGIDPDLAERLGDRLSSVADSTHRMEGIIDDILTIAREGKTVENPVPLDLETVATEAWGNVDTKAANLQVAESRTLEADHSKLLTIFENLFRNAIDHGREDVTVEVGTTDDGFYVADDGPGIPDADRDSIFEYGYTTSEEGTGLGLSIVKTMADSHGWTIEYDSAAEGARFVLRTVVGEGSETSVDQRTTGPESETAGPPGAAEPEQD